MNSTAYNKSVEPVFPANSSGLSPMETDTFTKGDIVFWTGIMRDHAIFQINSFSPSEANYVRSSMQYMNFFQQTLNRLEGGESLEDVIPVLINGLVSFINYKKILLNGLMTCRIQMNLPPSLINHMINEAMEFKDLLVMPEKIDLRMPLQLAKWIKTWVLDASGHAAAIAAFLDPVEGLLAGETKKFMEDFSKLTLKASELELMISRTGIKYEALKYLAHEAVEMMERFILLLEKVKMLRMTCRILAMGTLSPLLPDHMIREHRYFINKIKAAG